MRPLLNISTVTAILLFAIPFGTEAYIGPGAGISAIGTVIALVGAILLAIVGFVWYPVKRLLKKRKTASTDTSAQQEQSTEQDSPD